MAWRRWWRDAGAMAIVDSYVPKGPKTPSVGWNNGGGLPQRRYVEARSDTVPPDPTCTTVAVTLRWVQRQPGTSGAAGDRIEDRDRSRWTRDRPVFALDRQRCAKR